jgi:hypothetical protein
MHGSGSARSRNDKQGADECVREGGKQGGRGINQGGKTFSSDLSTRMNPMR